MGCLDLGDDVDDHGMARGRIPRARTVSGICEDDLRKTSLILPLFLIPFIFMKSIVMSNPPY